jgi:hypothetical protein
MDDPVRRQSLEYRMVRDSLMRTPFRNSMERWHVQGMYVFTPSGKLLAGSNHPWHPEINLEQLRKGLDAYKQMPRAERLLPRAPDPRNDRMYPERARPTPPGDGLVLRSVVRGFEEKVREGCQLAPVYYQVDHLWYTRDEAMQILPERLERGATRQISGPVFDAIIRLYLSGGGPQWHEPDVKEARLTSEVTAVDGSSVQLKLTGRVVLDADDQFNKNKYRPDLLGFATYDTASRRYSRFELLAYGMHSLWINDQVPGGPSSIPLGVLFTIAGNGPYDSHPPTRMGLYPWVGLKSRQ